MVRLFKLWWLFGPCLVLLWSSTARADGGWQQVGWGGQHINVVVTNPTNPQQIAVGVNGSLRLSRDGGIVWLPAVIPAVVTAAAYDPVWPGRMYAGTTAGLYVSQDDGVSWHLLETIQTPRKIINAVTVDNQYVFASLYDGAGTPVQVVRFSREGAVTILNFPDGNASSFSVDSSRHRLYVGSAGGVLWSGDEGASWQGGGRGAGSFTARVVAKADAIWQLSADGLYRSRDAGQSWGRLAGPGDINNTFYGSTMHVSGLAVSGQSAYYGDWSIGFPYQFLVAYAGGGAHSVFDGRVNDVAISRSRIWIATDNGLWVNDSLVGNDAAVRRPVLIVPGILGSLPTTSGLKAYASAIVEDGYWSPGYKTPLELDPVAHTYDGLINYLLARGYQRDRTLFVFPYNWTQDNRLTADQLAAKLADIRKSCGCSQVDIVAHSMGGLIARAYIQSDHYQGDVANIIQLATPNAGAVDDYAVWESGQYDELKTSNQLLNVMIKVLMAPQTDVAKVSLVRNLLPSIGQLLPVFNYLSGRQYPAGYPRNSFLEELNQPAEITRLRQRVATYLVGANTRPTLQTLTVSAMAPQAPVWPEGSILSVVNGLGDGTVLQSSLETVDTASLLLDADHGGIVTASAPFVACTLMGGCPADSDSTTDSQPFQPPSKYLFVYATGNVSLKLTDLTGTVDDTAISIPGAYYSGSTTTPQLIVIPEFSPKSYSIQVKGSGPYSVATTEVPLRNGSDEVVASSINSSSFSSSLTAGAAAAFTYNGTLHQVLGPISPSQPANLSAALPSTSGDALSQPSFTTQLQGKTVLPALFRERPSQPAVILSPSRHHFSQRLRYGLRHLRLILVGIIVFFLLMIALILRL